MHAIISGDFSKVCVNLQTDVELEHRNEGLLYSKA